MTTMGKNGYNPCPCLPTRPPAVILLPRLTFNRFAPFLCARPLQSSHAHPITTGGGLWV